MDDRHKLVSMAMMMKKWHSSDKTEQSTCIYVCMYVCMYICITEYIYECGMLTERLNVGKIMRCG